MKVIINSLIVVSLADIVTAEAEAITAVNAKDVKNEQIAGEDVISKLYFIAPDLGVIVVAVSDTDKETLGVESNILASTNISEYPLEMLPAQLVEYKELIIKVGSSITPENILNAAQSIVSSMAMQTGNKKVPVVKVINYNNDEPNQLVMPSIYGDNIFSSVGGIINGGDADAGDDIIENSDSLVMSIDPFGDGSLVAKYLLDGDGKDLCGNYNLTEAGTVVFDIEGKFDTALSNNGGESNFFKMDSQDFADTLNDGNSYSISGWVKCNLDVDISIPWGSSGGSIFHHFTYLSDGRCEYCLGNGVDSYIWITLPGVIADTWYHEVFVRNGDSVKIYRDGELVVDETFAEITDVVPGWGIGARIQEDGVAKLGHSGLVDQLEIYNRTLTAEEITKLYNQK